MNTSTRTSNTAESTRASLLLASRPTDRDTSLHLQGVGPHGAARAGTDRLVPRLLMTREDARRRLANDRAQSLVGILDGRTPVFELLAATRLPFREAIDALVVLYEAGIITLDAPEAEAGAVEARIDHPARRGATRLA